MKSMFASFCSLGLVLLILSLFVGCVAPTMPTPLPKKEIGVLGILPIDPCKVNTLIEVQCKEVGNEVPNPDGAQLGGSSHARYVRSER